MPRIPDVLGWLECAVDQLVDGGNNLVLLGLGRAAETADGVQLTYRSESSAPTPRWN